jgi:hypothetical protein
VFKKVYFLFFLIFTLSNACKVFKPETFMISATNKGAKNYLKIINKDTLYDLLFHISSDEFEGRETSYKGQKLAANFLKNKLKYWEIDHPRALDGYYQAFNVKVQDFSNVSLSLNNDTLLFIDDYYSFGNPLESKHSKITCVDIGYGLSNKNYNTFSVKDKVLLVKEGVPNNKEYSVKDGNWRRKVKMATDSGALAIIFKKSDYVNKDANLKQHLKTPRMKMHNEKEKKQQIPTFFVNDNFFSKDTTYKVSFTTKINQIRTAENVIGFIPGKTDEILVISAHYDHIGFDRGEICNGADDDGSGTVALLSIAKAFKAAHLDGFIPKRGILFLMVSGEEKGLFGSKFYTDYPVFPISKTIANLNIDMIGRKDTVKSNNNYIYLIGSDKISKDLHVINEQINKKFINFELDYTYNDENDPNQFYYRSDHYNFAKNNVPVIFYFGGLHEDYHKPSDEIEKIEFDKLEKTSRYIFLTAWELAFRKNRIK